MKNIIFAVLLLANINPAIAATTVDAFDQTVAKDFGQRTEAANIRDSILAAGDLVVLYAGTKIILKPRYSLYRYEDTGFGSKKFVLKQRGVAGPARQIYDPRYGNCCVMVDTGRATKAFFLAGVLYSIYDVGTRAYLFMQEKDSNYSAGIEIAKGTCSRSDECQVAVQKLKEANAYVKKIKTALME